MLSLDSHCEFRPGFSRSHSSLVVISLAVLILIVAGQSTYAGTITVPAGGDLQAALNAAQYGDTIILQAGATYRNAFNGNPRDFGFIAPQKTGDGWITITTSGNIPAGRNNPANVPQMATIAANGAPTAINFAAGAHHYRFVGIHFTNVANTGVHTHSLAFGISVPYAHDIEFDRCVFRPVEDITDPDGLSRSVTRGVWIDGIGISVKNSWLGGFTGRYKYGPAEIIDSECFLTVSGPGPYQIINNFLEAWFNNIFTGGGGTPTSNTAAIQSSTLTSATLSQSANLNVGDYISFQQGSYPNANAKVLTKSGNTITFTLHRYQAAPVPPVVGSIARWNGQTIRNIEIRRNTFHKRPAWAHGNIGNPKAYMEIKTAEGLIVDGNIFQGVPSNIGLTARNQSGDTPWTTIENVQITNNRIDSYSTAITLLLADSYHLNRPGGNALIANNVFNSPGDPVHGTRLFYVSGGSNIRILHNTALGNSHSSVLGDAVIPGFEYRDNLTLSGEYVMPCFVGNGSPNSCWPNAVVTRNVWIDTRSSSGSPITGYPNNFRAANVPAVGFINHAAGNYRLSTTSPYRNAASDGADIGANIDALEAAMGGSSTPPPPTPIPTPTPPPPGPVPSPSVVPTPAPSPTPTPSPGTMVGVNGYVRVNDVRTGGITVAVRSTTGDLFASTISRTPDGYFEFASVPLGRLLTVDGASPQTINSGGTYFFNISGPAPTPSPTPPPTNTGPSVRRAKSSGQSLSNLIAATGGTFGSNVAVAMNAASREALVLFTNEIVAAQLNFNNERHIFPAAARIELELNYALQCALDAITSSDQGDVSGVRTHLRAAINHLELIDVLIYHGNVTNAIDVTSYMVRQHYVDFLDREPDPSGNDFWVNQINNCGTNSLCIEVNRIHVSAAFFLSIEFRQTGYFVYRLYRSSFGRMPSRLEFIPDTRAVAQGLIVREPGWEDRLAASKEAFLESWVQRPDFMAYYSTLTNSQYVDALIGNIGVPISAAERNRLVQDLANGASRASILGRLVENQLFSEAQLNSAFVLMQYLGYLGRDPDSEGYNFWLNKLNEFNGDYGRAEMVRAFLSSSEYRNRFRL